MIGDHWLLGAGPEGFRDAYLLVRLPRAPEEIGSAHSVMVDWLAAIGVTALAWIGLVAWMLVRLVGRSAHEPPTQRARTAGLEPAAEGASLPRREIVVPLLALAIGFAPSLLIEGAIFTPADLVLRGVGVGGWLVLAIFLDVLFGRCAGSVGILEWTLAVAMAALLLHAQIEMTLWMPGSALFALALLGAAATAPARGVGWAARAGAVSARARRGSPRVPRLAAGLPAAVAVDRCRHAPADVVDHAPPSSQCPPMRPGSRRRPAKRLQPACARRGRRGRSTPHRQRVQSSRCSSLPC